MKHNSRPISRWSRYVGSCCAALLFVIAVIPVGQSQAVKEPERAKAQPVPELAMPAILALWDEYEVIGMPEGHGMKDEDDFILSLIRHPAFPQMVSDIVVECGNSLYQPVLDRYIAGEEIRFAEASKFWRNTTQTVMCDLSGFFEELFPLVRAIIKGFQQRNAFAC